MPQEIIITPVLNGFIVRAGCQTLVYDNPDKIKMDFASWVDNPNCIEARFGKLMEAKGLRNSPPPESCAPMSVQSKPDQSTAQLRR